MKGIVGPVVVFLIAGMVISTLETAWKLKQNKPIMDARIKAEIEDSEE